MRLQLGGIGCSLQRFLLPTRETLSSPVSAPFITNISLSVTLSWRWPLSEMFQKVQLAAMKNDKFYFVATVTQVHPPSVSCHPANSAYPTFCTPILLYPCTGFTLLLLFYYLSSLLRKQQPSTKRGTRRNRGN